MNESNIESAPRRSLARLFLHYNPFYLLSAMCMIAGLFALNNSLDWSPLPRHNLLFLLLILNVYEILLVGFGIFLSRRGLMRDAATLFVLEAFFLVDAGFLNSEVFTSDFTLGLLINIALFILAAGKVAAVFVGLRVPLSDGRYPLILAQLLILLAMPGLFRQVSAANHATLPPLAIYAAWWAVGLIPILYLLLMRSEVSPLHRGIIGTFVLLPVVSILAHLCTSNWVYHVRWYHANMAPLLLGLAVAAGASDRHVRNLAARMRLHLALPLLAIALATPYPSSLIFHIDDALMTPMRLTLLGAVLVYLHGLLLHRHPYFGVAGAMCLTAAGLGEGPATMTSNIVTMGDKSVSTLWRLVPRTVGQWGVVSVVASFVLLGLGLLVSLVKPAQERIGEPSELN